uniref:Uncharacterized protein n=1 Tax=Panagrolaimus sp. ES5 TaxID=591445 RepID=A0AC34FG76_9BILA
MLPVFANNYSECRLTPDAFYLVPNYVHVISIKRMHLDQAQYYESFENASNPTFLKSNLDASTDKWMAKYLKLSGTFGAEYKYLKTTLVKERLWLMRKTFSYTAYTLTADPDMFHPTFAGIYI